MDQQQQQPHGAAAAPQAPADAAAAADANRHHPPQQPESDHTAATTYETMRSSLAEEPQQSSSSSSEQSIISEPDEKSSSSSSNSNSGGGGFVVVTAGAAPSTAAAVSVASAPTDEEQSARRPIPPPAAQRSTSADNIQHHDSLTAPTRAETPQPRRPPQHPEPPQQQQDPHPGDGGRLWRLAGEIAAGQQAPHSLLLLGTSNNGSANIGGQLKETFLERMRSRAEPDAITCAPPPTPPRPDPRTTPAILVKMTDTSADDVHHHRGGEEEAFLMNTGLAHKRVRVVQLLIIGLVGVLLGWLGNFFVSSSCYFASVPVQVGQNGDVFELRFGLWNYSPVDSALNGFKYCYPYGGQHVSDAPVVSRACNLAALLAGTYSLVVLWVYLISARVNAKFWEAAVYAAFAAGVLQFGTPIFFFTGRMCRNASCSAGPAAALAAVTAVAWAVLGAELYYHCPVVEEDDDDDDEGGIQQQPDCAASATDGSAAGASISKGSSSASSTTLAQLEMADLASASQEYLDRFQRKHQARGRYHPPEFA